MADPGDRRAAMRGTAAAQQGTRSPRALRLQAHDNRSWGRPSDQGAPSNIKRIAPTPLSRLRRNRRLRLVSREPVPCISEACRVWKLLGLPVRNSTKHRVFPCHGRHLRETLTGWPLCSGEDASELDGIADDLHPQRHETCTTRFGRTQPSAQRVIGRNTCDRRYGYGQGRVEKHMGGFLGRPVGPSFVLCFSTSPYRSPSTAGLHPGPGGVLPRYPPPPTHRCRHTAGGLGARRAPRGGPRPRGDKRRLRTCYCTNDDGCAGEG